MEASPLPFLLNQDLDFSSFYNLFPEMSDLGGGIDDGPFNFKKQKTEDVVDDEFDAKFNHSLKDALSSLFFTTGQEQNSPPFDSDQNRAQAMSDFYSSREVDSSSSARPSKRGRSAAESVSQAPARRLWVKDRSTDWWDQVSRPDFPEEEFRKAFRMSRATFDMICEELDAAVTKKNTTLRDAIPVRQRVAVCIWRLATGEPLRLVSKRFGLGISTCHKLVLEVCAAMKKVLMPKFIHWPESEDQLRATKAGFESISGGIPNLGGSMYTTHIPIIAPKDGPAAYYNKRHTEKNQKPSYSITVQGVTDCRGIFTDVYIGWPGSFSDDKVLESSTLYKKAAAGQLSNLRIAANSGLPLTDWTLVPYSHQNLTWTQNVFNDKLDDVLKVSKDAFCRLKGRWACLQKRTEVKLMELPAVLGACCVLHNICEINGDEMSNDLRFEVFDDEVVLEKNVRSVGAVQARDQIAHKLLHHGPENAFL